MPFVKETKNKAYYKRYQVKYRRRRAGKTDYRARKRLVAVDKNKYDKSPRYRLVVRLTNKYVIAQVIYADIKGDHVFSSAYSSELPRYGIKVGLKNYAAAYATGLLVARRLLTVDLPAWAKKNNLPDLKLGELYKGNEKVTGEIVQDESKTYFVKEVAEDARPFHCVLDVGIRNTTTGARVFGALKGAVDGGLDIPHNHKRFPGYNPESKEYKPAVHKDRIFGAHVAKYMDALKKEDAATYEKRFSKYIAAGLDASKIEATYKNAHAAIRKDASRAAKVVYTSAPKFSNPAKRTNAERKEAVAAKKAARLEKLRAAVTAADSDEE